MNSRYKDKLVGVYAPSSHGHTSVLGQTQEFSKWFWANHEDMEYISAKLGIGDTLVTIIVLAHQLDLDVTECLSIAYEEIKNRKGKMINGTFVKEEDL